MKIFYSTPRTGGGEIVNIFKDKSIGMIGVVGGCYISQHSTGWWDSRPYSKGQIIQGMKKNEGQYYSELQDFNNKNIKHNNVVAIDGLFMAIPHSLFIDKLIQFDSNTFKGFHFYDLDMSMQICNSGYKIHVSNDIMIEHRSIGGFKSSFYEDLYKFHKKWNDKLPITSIPQSFIAKKYLEEQQLIFLKHIKYLHKINSEQNQLLSLLPHRIFTKLYLEYIKIMKKFHIHE